MKYYLISICAIAFINCLVPQSQLQATGSVEDRLLVFVNATERYQLIEVFVDDQSVFKGFVLSGGEASEAEQNAFSSRIKPSLLFILPSGIVPDSRVTITSSKKGSSASFKFDSQIGVRMHPDGLRMVIIGSQGSLIPASIPTPTDSSFLDLFGDLPGSK